MRRTTFRRLKKRAACSHACRSAVCRHTDAGCTLRYII